jgi:hypothetical protein
LVRGRRDKSPAPAAGSAGNAVEELSGIKLQDRELLKATRARKRSAAGKKGAPKRKLSDRSRSAR